MLLQQCLPFTVLKPESENDAHPNLIVATVLTVYGIETVGSLNVLIIL